MEKFFNTVDPSKPDIHYKVNPLRRIDLDEVMMLIRHLIQQPQWYENADNSINMEKQREYNGYLMMVWGI